MGGRRIGMVWIEASAEYETTIRAARTDIIAYIRNIPVSGLLFPGIDRIEPLGDERYRFVIKERRTLGISFIGNYIAQYETTDDQVAWRTVEGNMKTTGAWRLSGPDRSVVVRVESTTELEVPLPRLLKTPATMFAAKETKDGIRAQLDGIKAAVERQS